MLTAFSEVQPVRQPVQSRPVNPSGSEVAAIASFLLEQIRKFRFGHIGGTSACGRRGLADEFVENGKVAFVKTGLITRFFFQRTELIGSRFSFGANIIHT